MFFKKLFKKGGTKEEKKSPKLPPSYKVALLGDKTAYKFSFLETFIKGDPSVFTDLHRPDLEFRRKEVKVSGDKTVTLNIWNINSKAKSDPSPYLSKADGIILYFNPANKETFESLKLIVEKNLERLSDQKVPVQFVCASERKEEGENATEDGDGERKEGDNEPPKTPVAQEEAEEFSRSIGRDLSSCCLNDVDSVNRVFETLTSDMIRVREQTEECYKGESKGKLTILPGPPSAEIGDKETIKVTIVGECETGKTSLQLHYALDVDLDPFKKVSFGTTYLKTPNGKTVKLETWDRLEKNPYDPFPRGRLTKSDTVIVCLDATDPESPTFPLHWLNTVDRYCSETVSTVFACTKSDLASPENITALRERGESLGAPFVMCNTKTGTGMDELLEKVLEMTEAKKNLDFGMVEKEPQKAEKLKFKFGKRN